MRRFEPGEYVTINSIYGHKFSMGSRVLVVKSGITSLLCTDGSMVQYVMMHQVSEFALKLNQHTQII
jgi:hypothetical protein